MIRSVFVCFLVAAPIGDTPAEQSDDRSKPNFTMPELVAVSRADNDWVPYVDDDSPTMPIPPDVSATLREFVAAKYREYVDNYECHGDYCLRLDEFYRGTFVVVGPAGLDVYAMNLEGDCGWSGAYFFAHDTTTGTITGKPAEVDTHWMDENSGGLADLVQRPLVSFDDVDSDGRPELVIERQAHNGTGYNAAVRLFFHIATDASLTQILAVEDSSIDPILVDEDVRLVKSVIRGGPNRIRLHVDVEREGARESRTCLGDVFLVTSGAPSPFHVCSYRIAVETFDNVPSVELLISTRSGDDDAFLEGR